MSKEREIEPEKKEKYNHAPVKERNCQRFFSMTPVFLCSEVKLVHTFTSNYREKLAFYSLCSLELSRVQILSVAFHIYPYELFG